MSEGWGLGRLEEGKRGKGGGENGERQNEGEGERRK